jgi:hypothetical protein
MQLCDPQVQSPRDFLTVHAVETLVEFRNYSFAASGLQAILLVFWHISMI